MNFNLLDLTQAIPNVVSAVIGSALGLGAKILWDGKYGERLRSTDELIRRLKEHRLSSYGRDRLQKEAKQALTEWQKRLPPPVDSRKLKQWPKYNQAICVRALGSDEDGSSCPTGSPAGGVPPLFVRLSYTNKNTDRHATTKQTDVLGRAATAGVVEEIRLHFEALANSVKDSSDLISIGEWPKGDEPKLWIYAPEFSIRSRADATTLLQELSSAARMWIPEVQIILEMYLPQDVQSQLSKSHKIISDEKNKLGAVTKVKPASYGARYVWARDEVQRTLAQGIILGGLESPDTYSIPEPILRARLARQLKLDEVAPELWTTLPVFGLPGSGKTETVGLLAKQLVESQRAIVIICSTPELLADVEALASKNRETAFFSFAKDICLSYDLLPARFRDEEFIEAFMDCLNELLCAGGRGQQLIIVVDDLHARREIRESLAKVRPEAKDWGLHFILISRSRIDTLPGENECKVELQCEHWDRRDAEQILKSWVGKERAQNIDAALNEGWLAKRIQFSIYLLRTIAENIDDLGHDEVKPSELLEKAINKHLSGLSLEITAKQSPAEVLARIEALLKRQAPPQRILDEIHRESTPDYVTLLGVLSWVSHFEHQDFLLDAKKIRDWSQDRIGTEEEAALLLNAGTKVGVFTSFRGSAMWHDKLISDGCAALYLGREVERKTLNDGLIGEMIGRLEKATSVDILTLALDTPVLVRIIEAIANENPKLAFVIPKLITSDFILQLKKKPEWLHGFWAHLWKHGAAVQVNRMQPFALVLQRLMALDSVLETKCRTALTEGHDSLLALAILAVAFPDCDRFFDEIETFAPPFVMPTAAEVAARYCKPETWRALLDRLLFLEDSGLPESESTRVWGLWCAREKDVTVSDLLETAKHLLSYPIDHKAQKSLGRFANLCLQEGIGNRPPSQVIGCDNRIEELTQLVREMAKKGNPVGGKLIKWIALFYGSDLVERDGEWLVDKTGSFAIPRKPYNPLKIRQVFGRVSSAYPRFQLAAANEIKNLPRGEGTTSELVRDYLPKRFSYNEAFVPSNCGVWNGSLSYVTRDEVDAVVVAWRPRLNLEI
jgi:hypothetical protein